MYRHPGIECTIRILKDGLRVPACSTQFSFLGLATPEEFDKIKEHPTIGANILEQMGFWEKERQIILCHHERYDGTGYPDGLKKEQIPFLARILSVADVYDAMASDRAYRKRMEEDLILKIIDLLIFSR